MTTQIALLNLSGIAIASDTLASFKTGSAFKHSQGNSKIWQPGGNHQVAVYHSGSAVFNSMPHQIHVEAWFRTLTKPLATVKDYAESYMRYCASKVSAHSAESELALTKSIFAELVRVIRGYADESGVKPEDNQQWNQVIYTEAKNAFEYYNELESFAKTSLTWVDETLKLQKFNVKEELKTLIPEGITLKTQNMILKAFKQYFFKVVSTENDSTLTFAGYGEKDIYPSAYKIIFRGILNGKVLAESNALREMKPTVNTAGILYGAQTDAIFGLIQGYRNQVSNRLRNILGNHLDEGEQKEAQIDRVITDLNDVTVDDYVNPAFRRIANSSCQELAELANDMLNLQVLSAKLSGNQETVGGDIEVLTIDKTNGIRWQNRI